MYAYRFHANDRHMFLLGAAVALALLGFFAGSAAADNWYGTQTWPVGATSPYPAGMETQSPLDFPTAKAKILKGFNAQPHGINVKMEWGYRYDDEHWLSADIMRVTGNEGNKYVLQMGYDEAALRGHEAEWAASGEQTIYVDDLVCHWLTVWDYMHFLAGETVPMYNDPLYNFQGSWQAAGEPFVLGAFGVDVVENTVWAVINFDGVFVPEPGAMLLLAVGGLGVLWRRRNAL
jgi:hypothetical protein